MNHVNTIRINDEYQCSHCGKSWDIHEEAPDCKMTIIDKNKHKTVDYFGLKLTVDNDANFIATDDDGCIFSYFSEPYPTGIAWKVNFGGAHYLCQVNLHGLDWRETLRKC